MREQGTIDKNGTVNILFEEDVNNKTYQVSAEFVNMQEYEMTIDWVKEIARLKLDEKISAG